MAIRLPLQSYTIVDSAYGVGTNSINGGTATTFVLPQDTDNVVVKFTASVTGGGVSATFQTTDDGGTTWYDVARTSTVSNANNAVTAEWLSIPVISQGLSFTPSSSVIFTGSVVAVNQTVGRAAASTLGSRQYSGLPIMSPTNRIFVIATGTVTATSLIQTVIRANSQSATA